MQSLTQAPGSVSKSVYTNLVRMMQTEGFFRPVRGMSAVVLGAGPAHALYFSCYEKIKVLLVSRTPSSYNHLAYGNIINLVNNESNHQFNNENNH